MSSHVSPPTKTSAKRRLGDLDTGLLIDDAILNTPSVEPHGVYYCILLTQRPPPWGLFAEWSSLPAVALALNFWARKASSGSRVARCSSAQRRGSTFVSCVGVRGKVYARLAF